VCSKVQYAVLFTFLTPTLFKTFVSVYVKGETDVGTYLCQVLDRNYSVDISSEL